MSICQNKSVKCHVTVLTKDKIARICEDIVNHPKFTLDAQPCKVAEGGIRLKGNDYYIKDIRFHYLTTWPVLSETDTRQMWLGDKTILPIHDGQFYLHFKAFHANDDEYRWTKKQIKAVKQIFKNYE